MQRAVTANKRDVRRDDTRGKILEALVASLVAVGYARTTTVEVQRRAGVSRGALLHHFSTRDELFEAAVRHLVEQNEAAVRESLARLPEGLSRVERAIGALAEALRRPAYSAELELWAAARTDPELRSVLRKAERGARRELTRVIAELFGEPWSSAPDFPAVSAMTVEMLRGLAISRALRADAAREAALVAEWAALARRLLAERNRP